MPETKDAKPIDVQPIAKPDVAKSAEEKRKVAGHRVSVIGKGVHVVGGSRLRKGQHYSMDSLKGAKISDLRKDPHLVIEPVNSDGEVIAPKPGEFIEDDDAE